MPKAQTKVSRFFSSRPRTLRSKTTAPFPRTPYRMSGLITSVAPTLKRRKHDIKQLFQFINDKILGDDDNFLLTDLTDESINKIAFPNRNAGMKPDLIAMLRKKSPYLKSFSDEDLLERPIREIFNAPKQRKKATASDSESYSLSDDFDYSPYDAWDYEQNDKVEPDRISPEHMPNPVRSSNITRKLKLRIQDDDCAICLEPLVKSLGNTSKLPCGHTFHKKCIRDVMRTKMQCPMCRRIIPSGFVV